MCAIIFFLILTYAIKLFRLLTLSLNFFINFEYTILFESSPPARIRIFLFPILSLGRSFVCPSCQQDFII
jgi:hypothetical protein